MSDYVTHKELVEREDKLRDSVEKLAEKIDSSFKSVSETFAKIVEQQTKYRHEFDEKMTVRLNKIDDEISEMEKSKLDKSTFWTIVSIIIPIIGGMFWMTYDMRRDISTTAGIIQSLEFNMEENENN